MPFGKLAQLANAIALELAHLCAEAQPVPGSLRTAALEHADAVVAALDRHTTATATLAEQVELLRLRLERVDGRWDGLERFLAARFPDEYPRDRVASPGQE